MTNDLAANIIVLLSVLLTNSGMLADIVCTEQTYYVSDLIAVAHLARMTCEFSIYLGGPTLKAHIGIAISNGLFADCTNSKYNQRIANIAIKKKPLLGRKRKQRTYL